MAFSSSKDTLFGVCTLLPRRLERKGAREFLRVTKGVLGAMPFVVVAVLGSTIAVSAVLVMYMLVRRWLSGGVPSPSQPATPLSVGPPHLGPRRLCSQAAPSDDRRGSSTVPWLLLGARACSATPIAATRPSACHLSALL